MHIDSYFADVNGESRLPLGEWIHVVHTYDREDGKIYINGVLDGAAKPAAGHQNARRGCGSAAGITNYDFVGDIDEVRISKVARSADWVKLQYENQKPLQTLVGPRGAAGERVLRVDAESLWRRPNDYRGRRPERRGHGEGGRGSEGVLDLMRDGQETVVATDRFAFTFDAGRVTATRRSRSGARRSTPTK